MKIIMNEAIMDKLKELNVEKLWKYKLNITI